MKPANTAFPQFPPSTLRHSVKIEKPTINKGSRGKKLGGAGGTNYGKSDKDAIQTHTGYPRSNIYFEVEWTPIHPTQKPLPLCEYMIRTYTNEGMLVLDSCAGSGTSLLACKNTKRNFIGIEKDEGYFKLAFERLDKI